MEFGFHVYDEKKKELSTRKSVPDDRTFQLTCRQEFHQIGPGQITCVCGKYQFVKGVVSLVTNKDVPVKEVKEVHPKEKETHTKDKK